MVGYDASPAFHKVDDSFESFHKAPPARSQVLSSIMHGKVVDVQIHNSFIVSSWADHRLTFADTLISGGVLLDTKR